MDKIIPNGTYVKTPHGTGTIVSYSPNHRGPHSKGHYNVRLDIQAPAPLGMLASHAAVAPEDIKKIDTLIND